MILDDFLEFNLFYRFWSALLCVCGTLVVYQIVTPQLFFFRNFPFIFLCVLAFFLFEFEIFLLSLFSLLVIGDYFFSPASFLFIAIPLLLSFSKRLLFLQPFAMRMIFLLGGLVLFYVASAPLGLIADIRHSITILIFDASFFILLFLICYPFYEKTTVSQ
jgi:hypothetical protein